MRTLIQNGTCVTASDTFAADVWIENGKITALTQPGMKLGQPNAIIDKTIDAKGNTSFPAVSTRTRTSICRSAAPAPSTTSSRARWRRRTAARRRSSTSRFKRRADRCARRSTPGTPRPKGKALVDYAFHMIATDMPPSVLTEMGAIVNEGVTSFKMFMAYPGVLMLDDQSIFRAMLRAGELGALICMHAETGLPIDVLVERAIAATDIRRRSITRSRGRKWPRRRAPIAPSRWRRWRKCRSISCICRRSARSSG
jgi:dihydropyrimidinase